MKEEVDRMVEGGKVGKKIVEEGGKGMEYEEKMSGMVEEIG